MNGVQLLLIAGAGVAVTAVARRHHLEPGWIIVTLAAAASFLPGMPRLELDSELILAVVIPPLLYSATRGASISAFGANLRAIVALGVVLVVLTTGVLGLVATWLLPTLGGGAALVLGAVLAPPDTVTAVSHGPRSGLPRRAAAILTGESLVNDATALTLFAIAVAAVNGEHTTWTGGVLEFLRTALVGLAIGFALAAAALPVRKRLRDPTLETALVLLLPFTAFLAAEQVHASGILAVVAAAFFMSANLTLDPKHQYPGGYLTRVREEQVWPVVEFLLETFVFAYIGLQLRFVLADLAASEEPGLVPTLIAAGVLLAVAIVFRLVAVLTLFGRWNLGDRLATWRADRDPRYRRVRQARRERRTQRGGGEPLPPPSRKEMLLVGWTGMRGILTLAAAGGVPERTTSGAPFPGRDVIQAVALVVTLGTLLVQGTTIARLAQRLSFDLAEEEAQEARMREEARRIVAAADGAADPDAEADAVFDAQRLALSRAVRERRLTEEVARRMIDDVDLRQAARHTAG